MLGRYVFFAFFSFLSLSSYTQTHQTMYVSNGVLYDKCDHAIILHGINYPVVDDWDFPATSEVSAQIAQSGANAVRIQWYINYGQAGRPAYALADLDTVISRVARYGMIPIVELHDFTCQAGMAQLQNNIVPWFTQPDVWQLIEKHKAYLIINLANEFGYVNWDGDANTAQTTFQNAYSSAVVSLRNANIHVPIMIDAPDCGTSSDRLVNISSNLITADPDRNLVFSVHAYWYSYAQNDSATMRTHIQAMANSGQCFILGEVANFQDDGSYCTYALHYTSILHSAADIKVGWLIWAWYKDGCAARQISTAGNYSSLTAFGNDVVHNSTYGLQNIAVRSPYLISGSCMMDIKESQNITVSVYPNPANDVINITSNAGNNSVFSLVDVSGRLLYKTNFTGQNLQVNVSQFSSGIYFLQMNGKVVRKIIIE